MESKTLKMMIGLPRSGKSTYVKNNFKGAPVISADQIRLILYGQAFYANGEPFVWATRDVMLRALMEQGLPIVVDETNTTRKRREPIFRLAKQYGYEVDIVCVATPMDICIKRTDSEDLMAAVMRMHEQFENPVKSEGYRYSTVVSMDSGD